MTVKDLPDYEARLHLANLIGLDQVPEIDPYAIDELDGLWDDIDPEGEVDCVELVKSVRYRDYYNFEEKTSSNKHSSRKRSS